MKSTATAKPAVHFELLSPQGEIDLGNQPYIIILTDDYQTNGTDSLVTSSLQHSADILNTGITVEPRPDPAFPYIRYLIGTNRVDSWCYISMRNFPDKLEEIKAWMLKIASDYTLQHTTIDKMKVMYGTRDAATKIAWASTDLK